MRVIYWSIAGFGLMLITYFFALKDYRENVAPIYHQSINPSSMIPALDYAKIK